MRRLIIGMTGSTGAIFGVRMLEALKASVGKDRVRIETDDDDRAIVALEEQFGLRAARSEGMVGFSVERGEQFVPTLFREFRVPIRSVNVARPSLDDVFMSYTGKTMRDAEASAGEQARERIARVRGIRGGRS